MGELSKGSQWIHGENRFLSQILKFGQFEVVFFVSDQETFSRVPFVFALVHFYCSEENERFRNLK